MFMVKHLEKIYEPNAQVQAPVPSWPVHVSAFSILLKIIEVVGLMHILFFVYLLFFQRTRSFIY